MSGPDRGVVMIATCAHCEQSVYRDAHGDFRTVLVLTAITTDCYRNGREHEPTAYGHRVPS